MTAAAQHTPGPFVPSGTDLLQQIKAAEAKFDAARSRALNERAERAFRINKQLRREERRHDVRRHMYAGDDGQVALSKAAPKGEESK